MWLLKYSPLPRIFWKEKNSDLHDVMGPRKELKIYNSKRDVVALPGEHADEVIPPGPRLPKN